MSDTQIFDTSDGKAQNAMSSENVHEELIKNLKTKKPRKKVVLSEERKQQLREQLARGRETMRLKREAKKPASAKKPESKPTTLQDIPEKKESDYADTSENASSSGDSESKVDKSDQKEIVDDEEKLQLLHETEVLKEKLKTKRKGQKVGAIKRARASQSKNGKKKIIQDPPLDSGSSKPTRPQSSSENASKTKSSSENASPSNIGSPVPGSPVKGKRKYGIRMTR